MVEFFLTAGVDEAGRGPLIADVFAAAVILPKEYNLPHLNDSKKIRENRRNILAEEIKKQAIDYQISSATVEEIFELNILYAAMLAMKRAVMGLKIKPNSVLIDGNRIPDDLPCPARAIVGGDALNANIMAASILAKTARDAQMYELDAKYPEYGFAKHKGYGTKQHLQAIEKYGILPEHRRDFAPIKKWLENNR
ncbi:MAG: ribonuclease HII [Cardiobacteriaceae bacterium]|nr:ribonuclease HII [Cardiobacteriaceae bacterium]